jgi:hypothetical protein
MKPILGVNSTFGQRDGPLRAYRRAIHEEVAIVGRKALREALYDASDLVSVLTGDEILKDERETLGVYQTAGSFKNWRDSSITS